MPKGPRSINIGCALAAVQLLPRGVYVAMNGRVFPWDHVRKNTEVGVFEEKKFEEKKK